MIKVLRSEDVFRMRKCHAAPQSLIGRGKLKAPSQITAAAQVFRGVFRVFPVFSMRAPVFSGERGTPKGLRKRVHATRPPAVDLGGRRTQRANTRSHPLGHR